MPDIVNIIYRQRKLMAFLTLTATGVALVAALLSPKQYLGEATALPVNPQALDRARIFNANIEGLYSEMGTADELDPIEGTSRLDTLYLSVAADHQLVAHYHLDSSAGDALDKAALRLKKKTDIRRTGFGELKVKVWDRNKQMAATLANALLQRINEIHQRLQTDNNRKILQKLKEEFALKSTLLADFENQITPHQSSAATYGQTQKRNTDSFPEPRAGFQNASIEIPALAEQLKQYQKLIFEYELAVKTNPNVLTVVEHARPKPWADKPKTGQIVLLAFFASLLFSFLLALLMESRRGKA